MKRRDFLQGAASAAALPLAERFVADDKKIIAIQLDSVGLVDEGVERVLDEVQQRASVNTLMIDSLWFSPEVTVEALAKLETRGHTRDPHSKLIGGRMGFVRPQFYYDTGLDLKSLAPAPGRSDILAELSAAAKKRGLRVIPIIKDDVPDNAPGREKLLDRVRQTGLKNDFVYRETKRAVEGARGTNTMILPGLDVDIPVWQLDMGKTPLSEAARTTRQDVKKVVMQAFQAGVPGIVISREYCEMKLDNLSGAGDAIRELKLKT